MSASIHHINQGTEVAVINGAAAELVQHRELRSKYCTNRSIKTWATYFLLKSLTTSGVLSCWTKQKQSLLSYCKTTENSFRARLSEMKALKLVTISSSNSIILASFKDAAAILGIEYTGTTKIIYDENLPGKNIFQYFLRAEEIRQNQQKQLDALWYYAGKHPLLLNALNEQMTHHGADAKRLYSDADYFQQQLLQLQQVAFKNGSPLLGIIHQLRADVNRSCNGVKNAHSYKSKQSVSYMKGVMAKMQIVTIKKVCIESKERTRLYVIEPGERKRDAYKWLPNKQCTAWFLCDQIQHTYKVKTNTKKHEKKKNAA